MNNNNEHPYACGLDKNPANYTALTPTTFLDRAALVYPDHPAIIYGQLERSWQQTAQRCYQLARALTQRGISEGHTVAALLPNIPEMLELHFAIPMTGAVLNSLNTRLDAASIAFILQHSEADVLFVDREFASTAQDALSQLDRSLLVIDVEDNQYPQVNQCGELSYQQLLSEADEATELPPLQDEWQAITLNYTSGTTGNPKGVVYHHRGAYLNAVSNIMGQQLPQHAVYLWTLPMFHCNGWCYPWAVTAVAGTHVCLRHVRPEPIFAAINRHQVSHFCGAPIVLNMLVNAPAEQQPAINHPVTVTTGGAPPPATVIEQMEAMGIQVVHAYGLTESYGPAVFCDYQAHWDQLDKASKAAMMARQGVRSPMLDQLMVADPNTGAPVSQDGETLGEVYIRGNTIMKGYLKNPTASEDAFQGGWFHTGDLAVWHSDGYIEVKDRAKDVIISGGENISTIEVESTLFKHPAVLEAAVVAKADDTWGEVPCAFVSLKPDQQVSEQQLIDFCRDNMAHFKCPKQICFSDLPKTSTGKVQKFALRQQAQQL